MAINSQGSQFLHSGPGSPASYVAIEEVISIGGPQGTATLIDVSHLGSTRKEYLQGLADNGAVQLSCNFTGATKQMDMFTMFNTTADPEQFMLKIPSDSTKTTFHTFVFDGIVTKWELADATDAKVTLAITVQTTGGVTYSGVI